VAAFIVEAGLERYYALRGGRRTAPPPASGLGWLAWLEQEVERAPAEGTLRRLRLDVQGIHCAACVWLIQELARREPGAVDLRLNPAVGRVDLLWDTAAGDPARFVSEADRFGYRFGPARKGEGRGSQELVVRLAVASAAAMNVMIFSLSFYFGLAPRDGVLYPFFGWLNAGLGTVAVLVGGWPFFRSAARSLRRGWVHLDLPIAAGIALAYLGSMRAHLAHGPEAAYFDSLTVFVTLMLLGRWLQERHLARNRNTLLACEGIGGLVTRLIRDGRIEPRPAQEIRTGDRLCIVPGDLVPVAGVLASERAEISLDWILGESRARETGRGERVPAGAFNAGRSPLEILADEDFRDSRVNELFSGSVDTEGAPPDAWWQRLGTVWVLAVLGLATGAFLAWLPHGADRALRITISVLVVTCPCALGLAAPLARDLAHGHLRRMGVFVRRPDFLDRALRIRKVLFDKTGTLTNGNLEPTGAARAALAAADPRDAEVLRAMTERSNHPASRAIARELRRLGVAESREAGELSEHVGQGLEWRGAHVYRLGRPGFATGAPPRDDERVAWTRDGELIAELPLEEELRPDAAAEVSALTAAGQDVRILSGDAQERVAQAAARLGIPPSHARAGLSAEDKARLVRELDDGRDTLMIGDGLNDARAFAAAACAGTPAVERAALPARADFYFLGAGVDAVRLSLATARRLRRVLRDNLALAVAYNAGALVLCFAGLVGPLAAALLMPASSIALVSITAARLSGGDRWK
jgi:Cu2+-exporting ATPase